MCVSETGIEEPHDTMEMHTDSRPCMILKSNAMLSQSFTKETFSVLNFVTPDFTNEGHIIFTLGT